MIHSMTDHLQALRRKDLDVKAVAALAVAALLVFVAVTLAAAGAPQPRPVADPVIESVQEQCEHALGYEGRSTDAIAWLQDCVEALTPPTVPPTTAPPATTPPATTAPPVVTTPPPTTTAPPATTQPPVTTPPATTPPPPAASFPTATTTGHRDGGALTAAPCNLTTANAVYDHRLFDCSGSNWLDINAAGIKITNSVIYAGQHGGVEVHGQGGVVIEDTTIQGKASAFGGESAVSGSGFTLRRVKSLSGGDGIFVDGNAGVLVEGSYFEQHPVGGAHSDGIQLYNGGAGVVLRGNTFTQRGTPSTSPIFWSGSSGPGVRIEGNLLVGGQYSLRIGSNSGHGAVVTGNVIARDEWGSGTGPHSIPSPCGSRLVSWSDNWLGDVSSDYSAVANKAALTLPC